MRIAPLITALFLAVDPLASPAAGAATDANGALVAKAVVGLVVSIPRVLSLQLLDHPGSVTLSEQDVVRGEIVVRGTRLDIAANQRTGYVLRAELVNQAFSGLEIAGLERALHSDGGPVVLPMRSTAGRPRSEPLPVEYRLLLAAGTRPGTYAWPVALSVLEP
jgi:hypothetical protein